jgi:cytochrome c
LRSVRATTPHEVITNTGIAALLCHCCLRRWANHPGLRRSHEDTRVQIFRKGSLMQTQTDKVNPKTRISYYQISCEACHLNQFYHGKRHTKCIHCGAPLDLRKVKPNY